MNRATPVVGLALLAVLLLVAVLWGWPNYRVYSQEMRGRAAYAEAEQSRRIAVLDAQAEIARARGVAEANKIIGRSLEGNESYLRYLWIQGLQDSNGETVYIPTEAGLPIMESTRRPSAPAPAE